MSTVPVALHDLAPIPTESCFVPGTTLQWAWDGTSMGALQECPRMYQLGIVEGWTTQANAVELDFGLLFHHACLNVYWRALTGVAQGSHEVALRVVVAETLKHVRDWRTENTTRNRFTLLRSIVWYLDWVAQEHVQTVVVHGRPAVEQHTGCPLGRLTPDGAGSYVWFGHLDRLVVEQGLATDLDIKSTSANVDAGKFWERFTPDASLTGYMWLVAYTTGQAPIHVVIDAVQVAVGFTRCRRAQVSRTPAQVAEWVQTRHAWLERAEQLARDRFYPLNERACFRCRFRPVCSEDPTQRARLLQANYVKRPWNPTVPRGL